jgi:hypothetical protein
MAYALPASGVARTRWRWLHAYNNFERTIALLLGMVAQTIQRQIGLGRYRLHTVLARHRRVAQGRRTPAGRGADTRFRPDVPVPAQRLHTENYMAAIPARLGASYPAGCRRDSRIASRHCSMPACLQPCSLAALQPCRRTATPEPPERLFDDSHQLSALLGRPTASMAVGVTQALRARRHRPREAFYHQPDAFVRRW